MKNIYQRFRRVFQDPAFNRHFNGWAAIFFAVLIIPSMLFGWLEVVAFVSILSIWALVGSHWAAWQGAKVEQKEDVQAATRPLPRKVVHSKVKMRTRSFRKPL